jgi:DNA-binding SARP family transcriptional activator
MSEYPVQLSKVQAPPLREETLARDRLLEWLSVKVHRRAVLLTAEAGYGKTTLLADFSRRTRLRVLWYRLDRGDQDWVGFLAYLVAAVRIHIPDFGAATSSLLRETATSAPPLDTVLETFLRELGGLPSDPTALVFDDLHLVDDSPDVRHVLRELLARAPERLSFVFASRREPPVRLARLRALGEVAELRTDDLRFDPTETERLFRETYAMRLEPGLIAELSRRTEGWAASLQLVRAALHDRNPGQVRAFISSLSGAEGHLYDYLAEEVIGDLEPELQQFLMRTSLLETVDLALGPVAAGVSEAEARRLIEEGERHGLLGKGGPNTRHQVRAHPLVRDFLQARLTRTIGPDGLRTIHRDVAKAAEPLDWRVSGTHHLAAGEPDEARRVVAGAIEQILGTGAYAAAQELTSLLGDTALPGAPGLVIKSRIAQQRAAAMEGVALAEEAWSVDPSSMAVLLNLVTARTLAGDVAGALTAGHLLEQSARPELAEIGRVFRRTLETSLDGPLDLAASELRTLSTSLRQRGEHHFLGVALLNEAYLRCAMSEPRRGRDCAEEAITHLEATSGGVELVSARLALATALAYLGELNRAREEMSLASTQAAPGQALEVAIEVGQIEALLGETSRAWPLVELVKADVRPDTDNGEQALLTRALLRIRDGDLDGATQDVSRLSHGTPRSSMAFEARRLLAEGLLKTFRQEPGAKPTLEKASALASAQGARLWARYGTLLLALGDPRNDPSDAIIQAVTTDSVVVSMLAEAVVDRLPEFTADATTAVRTEAERRPSRWRQPARMRLGAASPQVVFAAAELLEDIGELGDVGRLRDLSRVVRDRSSSRLGLALARRLAPRVMVEDLGRVRVIVGPRVVEGTDIRRKVLGLLCFLVSRPRFASTREEVMESLWPDQDPSSALNSLNQTVYFLRRVFEPDYKDDWSPGYLVQDGETVWLDPELIDSRSSRCAQLLRVSPIDPSPEYAVAIANEYRGRFALDFAYDEWASTFRDSLHAAYLRVIEQAVRRDLDTGHVGRGTFLAQRASEVDPDAEEIQVALVRLYRLSGAHAAAAEQYGHYAQSMRDLGLEPMGISEL